MTSSAEKMDEISHILQHFQPKPEFMESAAVHRRKRKNHSVRIQYRKRMSCLELSYLHIHDAKNHNGMILRLHFHVSITKPYTAKCIHSSSLNDSIKNDTNNKVYRIVDDLCATVSLYSETKKDEISLFSAVSNLLVALNGKSVSQQLNDLRRHISSSNQKSIIDDNKQMILLPFQKDDEMQVSHALELQVFLLRCAATSKSSKATLVTPVPPSNLWDGGKNDGFTASRVLAVTNQSLSKKPRSIRSKTASSSFSEQQQRQLDRGQLEFFGFLSALPWTQQGKITTNPTTIKTTTTYPMKGGTKIEVCFDILDAIGDDSPRFAKLAKSRGVTTAYHGTKVDAIWSILNYGLLNLSDTRLCKNGSMLGNGIYVSPSLQVAEFFAQGTTLHPSVFWHWYQKHLMPQKAKAGACIPWLDSLPSNALDKYTVSCRAVVQARIILPPAPSAKIDQTSTDSVRGTEMNGNKYNNSCTRRDGKYFVVPSNQDIRVTALHLTFDFQPKTSFPVLMLAMLVIISVFLVYLI